MNPQFTQNLTQLSDFIIDSNEVGIVIGSHQTLDTVAAGLSLYLSLSQSGKNAQIVSIKEPLVEVSSLVGVDKIKKSFTGNTTKLVVALPYIKGEVEKVLFTEQADTINFHLTAAQGRTITPFDLNRVKLNWEGGAPKNIITVGVGNENELSDLIDVTNSRIVNIDNYQNNSKFGEIVLVDESFSSLSEIVGKILKDERLPYDADTAQNILDGVLFATRNFTKGNTSPAAFEAASNAMYQGAQRKVEATMGQSEQRSSNVSQNRPFDSTQGKGSNQPQIGSTSQNRPNDSASFGNNPQDRQGRQSRPYDVAPRPSMPQNQNSFDSQNRQQSRPFDPTQNRQNVTQGQRRDSRNSFGQPPFDNSQGKQDRQNQNQNRQPRVSDNDFPAMHIQDIRNQIKNDPRMQQNPRQNRGNQGFDNSSFGQPQDRQDRQDKRNSNQPQYDAPFEAPQGKPYGDSQGKQDRGFDSNIQNQPMSSMEDNFDVQPPVEEAQIVSPRPMPEPAVTQAPSFDDPPFDDAQGKQDKQMPEPESFDNVSDEDVPDDWLMPKVFKSSKNNN